MENKEKQHLDALSRLVESTWCSLVGSAGTVLIWAILGLPQAPIIAGSAAGFIVLAVIDFHSYLKQKYA